LSHGLSFGVTDFDLLEFVELHDGSSQVHDVLASLTEGIESYKESIGGDLPLVLALGLVIKVSLLEASAYLNTSSKASVSFSWVFSCNSFENTVTAHIVLALTNNSIADLTDENNKASRSVIVGRIGPDHENGVHDGDELARDFFKLN
jgi:hypothetical protein